MSGHGQRAGSGSTPQPSKGRRHALPRRRSSALRPVAVRLSDRVDPDWFRSIPLVSELGEGEFGASGIEPPINLETQHGLSAISVARAGQPHCSSEGSEFCVVQRAPGHESRLRAPLQLIAAINCDDRLRSELPPDAPNAFVQAR